MMKARAAFSTLMILLLCGPTYAASVEWIDGFGAVAPTKWSVSPSHPSTSQVISFSGPTDQSYSNSCVAEGALGGTPYLSISHATKTIELRFQGPAPDMCILILKPAVGLQGEFGPLAAGEWTFKSTQSNIAFELTFTVGGSGNVIYVDKNAPLTIWWPDGSSWVRAYTSLQDALAVAQPGDTIRVADGTYVPDDGSGITPGDRTASFAIPDGVSVLGGYAGNGHSNPNTRDVDGYPTILSGDVNQDDLWGILNTTENSFHVVSASGTGLLEGMMITAGNGDGFGNDGYGGGVFLEASEFVLNDCRVYGNKADFGAGIACLAGIAPAITNTEITGNWAYVLGGALYNEDANIEMTNCLITGNTAGSADTLGSDAILNAMGSLDITNCTIADNRPGHGSPPNGRAIMNFVWGPGFVDTISIKNSIIRNGGYEIWSTEPGIVTLYNNNVEGGAAAYTGIGNMDQDPLFKNPGLFGIEGQWFFDDDGYTLLAGSPSIDAGNQVLLPPGLARDLNGNARVQDGQVDQGAYEGAGLPPLPPAVVLVPNVVNQTQSAAQSAITSAGLVVGTISQAYSSTVSNGRVISQNPVGNSTAVVGASVDLTISKGPPPSAPWTPAGSSSINMTISNPPPSFPINVNGTGTFSFVASGSTDYKIEIAGVPGASGTWSTTPSSGTVSAGSHTISFTIKGTNVDLSSMPSGYQKIAEVKYYTKPH
jgi:hypothetical protein